MGDRKRLFIAHKHYGLLQLSRVYWNLANPDDMLQPKDEIHHRDGNRWNNHPDNLLKVSGQEHDLIHQHNPLLNTACLGGCPTIY